MMDDEINLGTCCNCGGRWNVRNVFCLHQRTPEPGVGAWGCVVCGLPAEGAIAVLCDACAEQVLKHGARIEQAVLGEAAECRRIPVENLPPGKFDHDHEKHYLEGMPYGSAN